MECHEMNEYANVSTFLQNTRSQKKDFLACINIGTCYSSFGFAPVENSVDVIVEKNWGASQNYVSYSTPTAVFRSGDKKRTSIGYDAYDNFRDQYEDYNAQFQPGIIMNFKHKIQAKSTVSRIRSLNSIGIVLNKMKEHVIYSINTKYDRRVTCDDIQWIIPVPSAWKINEIECNKLKNKALKVGIAGLEIVKESHAVFFQCVLHFDTKPPKRILVINAGGWDTEVSLFDKITQTKYKVIIDEAIGFGGDYVNTLFMEYLRKEDIFGSKFIAACKEKNPAVWLEIRNQFEVVKQGSKPSSDVASKMQLSQAFGELFHSVHGQTVTSYLKNGKDLTVSKDGKLVLSNRMMKYFYNYALRRILERLRTIMGDNRIDINDKIFLTGGFGSSEHLQQKVRKSFPDVQVIIPEQGNLYATKGCISKEAGVVSIC